MKRIRVPIIFAGEIRWLETGHGSERSDLAEPIRPNSTTPWTWLSGLLNGTQRSPQSRLMLFVVGTSMVVVVTFAVLRYLGPRWSPLLLSIAGIVAIFSCLGTRKAGTLSAYSVFNEGTQRLPGQLSADDIEREIRGGGMGIPRPQLPPPPVAAARGMRLGGIHDGRDDHTEEFFGADDEDEERCADALHTHICAGDVSAPCSIPSCSQTIRGGTEALRGRQMMPLLLTHSRA